MVKGQLKNSEIKMFEARIAAILGVVCLYRLLIESIGRVETVTDALARSITFDYDLNGNLKQVLDGRGLATKFDYDDRDRLYRIENPLTKAEYRAYDPNGNLTAVTDEKGCTTAFGYDDLDRLSRVKPPQSANPPMNKGILGRHQESPPPT